MNMLEHIECESSAESDLSVIYIYVEDDFNNASEDDDYRELSHESDFMANSSSSSTSRSTCLESASSSTSRSSVVSLLSVLRAPDLSRKQKSVYRYCIYGHCYSLRKQIKLLMSKILSIIDKKKRIAGKKNGKEKKQNRLVPSHL